jgi:hypothetical protein
MKSKYYVGDIGTEILLDTKVDLMGGTDAKIKVMKPDGSTIEWDAAIKDITKLSHVIAAGELDQAGTYMLQASITLGSWKGRGETAHMRVHNQFE